MCAAARRLGCGSIDRGETVLVLVDLGRGQDRLGGSALAQVYGRIGEVPPDLDDPALLKGFFSAMQHLKADGLLLAYHDRSDGGLLATLCEMAFAGRCGIDCDLGMLPGFSQKGRGIGCGWRRRWQRAASTTTQTA